MAEARTDVQGDQIAFDRLAELMPPTWANRISLVGDCWIWKGTIQPDGYGKLNGRGAHRVIYERLVGPVPVGMQLDHLCCTPPCVRPAHLEPVTDLENKRRRYATYTHCKAGHEFTPENAYIRPSGHRTCRACNRAAVARYASRKARGAA